MAKFRLPHIPDTNTKEQISGIKSFLYQLIEDLQFAFDTLDKATGKNNEKTEKSETSVILSSLGLSEGLSYGECNYRVTDERRHIYITFNCSFTYEGTAVAINKRQIPAAYRPSRDISRIVSCNDSVIAKVTVTTDGYIKIIWVMDFENTDNTTVSVTQIDGYLDYFTGG